MKVKQKTIKKENSFSGIGLHSGKLIKIKFLPAEENTGIVFIRTDFDKPEKIKVVPHNIIDTTMCTCIKNENGFKVSTIEHLMSALAILGIDNIEIEINGEEVPIMDGSAMPFIFILKECGFKNLNANKKFIKIKEQVKIKQDDKFVYLIPCDDNDFFINYEIDFNHPFIKETKQEFSISIFNENVINKILKARTFGFLKDIEYLKSIGLIKGGSTDNAIVLDEFKMINNSPLRYENEFVRHKILDSIGDLYVYGYQLIGKFKAYKSGHELNNLLIKELLSDEKNYEIIEIDEDRIMNFIENNLTELEIENNLQYI